MGNPATKGHHRVAVLFNLQSERTFSPPHGSIPARTAVKFHCLAMPKLSLNCVPFQLFTAIIRRSSNRVNSRIDAA